MDSVHFFQDSYFQLFWFLPVVLLVLFLRARLRKRRLEAFSKIERLLSWKKLGKYRPSKAREATKNLLCVAALACLVLALARPRWGFEWKELPQGGADIMVALDLSTSMLAQDLKPNRLEQAKRQISDLLQTLKGDRIGLVGFAGVSFVQCPLTVDYRMVDMLLGQLDIGQIPVQGTLIGQALRMSLDSLMKASSQESKARAIILITDGEDSEGTALAVAKEAAEQGVRIFTIGIGSAEGAPIPLPDGGFKKDSAGQLIVSKLVENELMELASAAQGQYVRADSPQWSLDSIYREIIGPTSAGSGSGTSEPTRQRIWYERFQWFVLPAILLLLIEFMTKRYSALLFLGFIVGASFHSPKGYANDVKDAKKAFEEKNYDDAAKSFQNAEVEEPNVLEHAYNKAVSQYMDSRFDEAAQGFTKAASSPNKELAQQSLFNLGNTLVAQGNLEQAIQAYTKALELHPNDKAVQENKSWVEKKLAQKPPPPKEDKDQKDDKKEEEKKGEQGEKDQKNQQDGKDQNSKKEGQDNKDEKKQDGQQKDNKDQKKENEKSQDAQQNEDEKNKAGEDQQPPNPSQEEEAQKEKPRQETMSEEDAERLLRSVETQEAPKTLVPKMMKPQNPPKKDW